MLLRAHVLLHLGILLVAQHLARRVHVLAGFAVGLVSLDDLAQSPLLTSQLRQLLVVGCNLGPAHLAFDLSIAPRNRLKTVDHSISRVARLCRATATTR